MGVPSSRGRGGARSFICQLPEPGIGDGRSREHTGTPTRARSCECDERVWLSDNDGGTCLRCGCTPLADIETAWAEYLSPARQRRKAA